MGGVWLLLSSRDRPEMVRVWRGMLADHRARFEEIYDAYSGLILAYAARRTPDLGDAADVVAETFMVAWRRIGDVPEGEQARPWLYGVARRVLANQRRGLERRRRLHVRLASELAGSIAVASFGEDEVDVEPIATAFGQLGEGDRELLTLVAWDGLSRDEIAAMLGCSTAAVRVRLHRARRRLEQQLNSDTLKRVGEAGHGSSRGAAALPDPEEA